MPLRLPRIGRLLDVPHPSSVISNGSSSASRSFTAVAQLHAGKAPHPPREPIPAAAITISYLKGSGPGGQKINKTSSAVQIKHLPSGIVIKCQETRSRDQNEKIAVRKLQDKLERMEKGEDSRIEKRRELLRKRKKSREKKAKRKYRALEAGKEEELQIEQEEEDGNEDGAEEDKTEDNTEIHRLADENSVAEVRVTDGVTQQQRGHPLPRKRHLQNNNDNG